MPGLPPITIPDFHGASDDPPEAGILGLEPDPFAYIGHLVLIFRETWRVLRDDGILCVNIGDTYSGSWYRGGTSKSTLAGRHEAAEPGSPNAMGNRVTAGYKPKDLMGIPWRLAFALIADGWTLRSRMAGGVEMRPDVIWTKNAMPESVRDRPSVDFEDVFIFSKQRRYCWDEMNSREATTGAAHSRGKGGYPKDDPSRGIYKLQREPIPTRNMRTSWYITTEPTPENHFAAFPSELVRRLIKIGTSDKGCCPECGAPARSAMRPGGATWELSSRSPTRRSRSADSATISPSSAAMAYHQESSQSSKGRYSPHLPPHNETDYSTFPTNPGLMEKKGAAPPEQTSPEVGVRARRLLEESDA